MNKIVRRRSFNFADIRAVTKTVLLICASTQVLSQSDLSFVFPDFVPPLASLNKEFSTTLVVITTDQNQSTFSKTVFEDAANSFYDGAFPGFIATENISEEIKTNTTNETSYTVKYGVRYNFTQLTADPTLRINDSVVEEAIGNVSAVKNGLERASSFIAIYAVSEDPSDFTFAGNRICPSGSVSCGSSQVFCNETELGLLPVCRSICHNQTICQNGASCVHNDRNAAPSCNCVGSSTIWYIGQYCEYKVEVWMIVVFLLSYLVLIVIILAIGCWCWKRAGKTRRKTANTFDGRKPSTHQGQSKTNASENTRRAVKNESTDNRARRGPQPQSSPSPLSSILEEYPTVEIAPITRREPPTDGDSLIDRRRESRESSNSSGSSSRGESEDMRPYNTLDYDSRANNDEVTASSYGNLDSAGNKSTQTNTPININLPDSILARNIS